MRDLQQLSAGAQRRFGGRRLLAVCGVAVLAATAAGGAGSAAGSDTESPFCTARTSPIRQGPALLVNRTTVDGTEGRLERVKLYAPALNGQTRVNVLLPSSYDPSGRTRYPVLYLLHGALGTYDDWRTLGNVRQIVDDVSQAAHLSPFIVVMPDAGTWGFYSDWYGSDVDGLSPDPPPAWTQYHIKELIPWIDGNFPTLASRTGRAVAGLSMGGFGAMSYAARFPDLFSSAGSFSGAVNPDMYYPYGNAYLTAASGVFNLGRIAQCVWGDMVTQQVHWEGNDPTYLAGGLAHTSLFIASGGGDASRPNGLAPTDGIEENCYLMSQALVSALDGDHIQHTDYFYGPGTHDWSFWQDDLRHFLPQMEAAWAHPPAAPPSQPFSYRSILPSFSVWDWSFTTHRDSTEFTYLRDVSSSGLEAVGSGRLDVVSAALYRRGSLYRVTEGESSTVVRADRAGRLSFPVDLGPSHGSQQQSFDSSATSSWTHASVTIAAASG